MADFYQAGVVATLHRLGTDRPGDIQNKLLRYSQERPIALVLPSLYTELEGVALRNIVTELRQVKYIKEVIVTLGPASENEFQIAKDFFSILPQPKKVIWNNGRRMTEIYRAIESQGLHTGSVGKGRSVWMAYGYVLSRSAFSTIALHDCDVLTYNRRMLARLCYPVTDPSLNYDFCQGFYTRVTDKMHGRATRLLVTPLIRSLETIIGYHPLLVFFDSFRYILAGESSIDVNLARINKIPGDWGLEVGTLAEVYRNTSINRVCQVDIADNYEHKHQVLSPGDATRGLHKMCVDICTSIFRTLSSEGIIFSHGLFKTLVATYARTAQDMLKRYEDDAAINGLRFDRHEESLAVETFTRGIRQAAGAIMEDPLGVPLISGWDRVTSAIPDILARIQEAVDADNN